MRLIVLMLACLFLAVACDRKEAVPSDAHADGQASEPTPDTGPTGPDHVAVALDPPDPFPLDDPGLAELSSAVPHHVLHPPLCGSNGPDYARRMAEESERYAGLLEAFVRQPDAGGRALAGVSAYTGYGRSRLQIASLDVVAALHPEGGEVVLDEAARAIVLAHPVGEAGQFGGAPYPLSVEMCLGTMAGYATDEADRRLAEFLHWVAAEETRRGYAWRVLRVIYNACRSADRPALAAATSKYLSLDPAEPLGLLVLDQVLRVCGVSQGEAVVPRLTAFIEALDDPRRVEAAEDWWGQEDRGVNTFAYRLSHWRRAALHALWFQDPGGAAAALIRDKCGRWGIDPATVIEAD